MGGQLITTILAGPNINQYSQQSVMNYICHYRTLP